MVIVVIRTKTSSVQIHQREEKEFELTNEIERSKNILFHRLSKYNMLFFAFQFLISVCNHCQITGVKIIIQ